MTFLALVVAELAHRRSAWLLAGAFVAYTVWARVYIGDHWISDAIGGVALGTAAACAAATWIEGRRGYAPAR